MFFWLEWTIKLPLKMSGEIEMEQFHLRDVYKVSIPGKSWCEICDKLTSYRNQGCKLLKPWACWIISTHRESPNTVVQLLGETNVWNWKPKKEPQNLNPKIEAVNFPMCDRIVNLYYGIIIIIIFYLILERMWCLLYAFTCIKHLTPLLPALSLPNSFKGFWFDLILYVPSTIFQLYRDGSSWVEPVLS